MLTLLVRGLTLPGVVNDHQDLYNHDNYNHNHDDHPLLNEGAGKGLLFFFTPQWEKLASLKVDNDNDDTEDGDYRTCQFKGRSYDDNRDCDGDFDAKEN